MPFFDDLIASPYDFLKMNLVVMRGFNFPMVAGSEGFKAVDLKAENNARCTRPSKRFWKGDYTNLGVWGIWHHLTPTPYAVDSTFGAGWLPYAPNTLQKAVLDDTDRIMLTAAMTGCSFGAVTFSSGQTQVCHVNFQTDDMLDTNSMAAAMLYFTRKLDQSRYRETIRGKRVALERQGQMGATVIGVNEGGWTFYAQQWELVDGMNDIYNYYELIRL